MAAEIIVVDDDPLVGALSNDILTDAGYQVHLIRDSRMAMAAIREHRPRLVVLDILMPGIDGLTLLHTIKNDEVLKTTKVIVVSGKSFSAEVERARQYGAETFIQKPYDVKTFAKNIADVIGAPANGSAQAQAQPKTAVTARFWGEHEPGSMPCMSLEALDLLFILDAGKGVVRLGEEILREGRYRTAWLLLTHYHAAHISGLGLFPCLRSRGFMLHIAGPAEPLKNLAAVLREAIQASFSSDPRPVSAAIKLHELREETYELKAGLRLSPFYANHPSNTLGFFLQLAGRKIAYCPASEVYGESATALQDYDEKTGRIIRAADLLVHDARYKDEDYESHKNEGHSSIANAVGFAAANEVERLVLINPDPAYPPSEYDALEQRAKAVLEEKGALIDCRVARDGLMLEF